MMIKILAIAMLLAFSYSAYAAEPISMARVDAMSAFNALYAISEYTTSAKQGGQDVVVKKFLDVALPTRSALTHDLTVLKAVAMETVKLQDDAKARLSGKELDVEMTAIAQQKVSVEGLMLITEADLQLDKNPQITLPLASILEVIESK